MKIEPKCTALTVLALALLIGGHAAQAQTAPAFGGTAKGNDAGGEEKSYRLLTVKHVYVGGIAALFKGSGVIPTGPFVSPGYANGFQNQNGGGFGGNQGGNFGFGGFGSNQNFGGNRGFGGNQGGFGGFRGGGFGG